VGLRQRRTNFCWEDVARLTGTPTPFLYHAGGAVDEVMQIGPVAGFAYRRGLAVQRKVATEVGVDRLGFDERWASCAVRRVRWGGHRRRGLRFVRRMDRKLKTRARAAF